MAASDTFDRADSSSIGADWSEDVDDWEILTNNLRLASTGSNYCKVRWVGTGISSADHYSQCDLTTGSNNERPLGPGVRMTAGTGGANNDGYWYRYEFFSQALLQRMDNGTPTTLATGSAGTVGASTAYTAVKLEANGSTLTGTRNGSADVSGSDSTYSTGGVGLFQGDLGGNTGGTFQQWSADDLGAPAASTVRIRRMMLLGVN